MIGLSGHWVISTLGFGYTSNCSISYLCLLITFKYLWAYTHKLLFNFIDFKVKTPFIKKKINLIYFYNVTLFSVLNKTTQR